MAISRQFRFETLLKIRRQQEDQQKRVVAQRLRGIHDLENRLNALEQQVQAHMRQLGDQLRESSMDLNQVRIERHWLAQLRRGILETQAGIKAQRAILAQEQATLTEAHKNTRIFEHLRERQRLAWIVQERKREQMESDELNAIRYARLSLSRGEVERR